MRKIIQKLKNRKGGIVNKISTLGSILCSLFIIAQTKVYAASNTESIDSFIAFACDWLTKIRRNYCTRGWSNVCPWLAERRCRTESHED